MTDRRTMLVPDGLAGERVDAAISRLFGLSRSRAADLATDGEVSVNGSTVSKSHRVHAEDLLEVVLPGTEPSVTLEIVAEPVPGMRIVHDDDEIVVVDKPVGVAAHPSLNWTGPNVLSGLKAAGYRISTSGASERQGIVSRLDVGTSGLMVVCKSERAYTVLKRAFKERRVDKTYHALVQGLPDPLVGTIDAPIGRRPSAEFKFAVMDSGEALGDALRADRGLPFRQPPRGQTRTGRTHQIRVHMAAIKHPCVGDPLYGADPNLARRLGLERQWLHAMALGFEHPGSGEWVTFESSYPADLDEALERLAAAH